MYYSELGYEDYGDFLMGKEWKAIKQFYFENCKKYECNICGSREQLLLHKRSYKFLSLPELKKRYRGDRTKIMRYLHTYMVYLCRGCNKKVHFENGTRIPLEYRKLREQEKKVRRRTRKVSTKPIVRHEKKMSFLGSYFERLIRK